jgi:hypothetical protein
MNLLRLIQIHVFEFTVILIHLQGSFVLPLHSLEKFLQISQISLLDFLKLFLCFAQYHLKLCILTHLIYRILYLHSNFLTFYTHFLQEVWLLLYIRWLNLV